MISVFKEFKGFITTGNFSEERKPVKELIVLFLILLVLRYAIVISKALLMGEDLQDASGSEDFLGPDKMISYIFIIPLIEELFFRGFLDLQRSKMISILIGIATLAGSVVYIKNGDWLYFVLFVVILLVFAYWRIESFRLAINRLIHKYYLLLVWLSAIFFALAHITNYDDYSIYTFMALVPRLISGVYLAFIVTKYTIWHSWMMHAVNNITPFIILLIVDSF